MPRGSDMGLMPADEVVLACAMTYTYAASEDFVDILRAERRAVLEVLRSTRFSKLREGYTYGQIIPHATYSPWFDDQRFMTLYDAIKDNTLVDIYRCFDLYLLAQQAERVDGALVEVGVWRGGTAALLAATVPGKAAHLFDTFDGVPEGGEHDTLYRGGEHSDTSRATVERLFHIVGAKAKLHPGMFPDDTLEHLPAAVALAHIDVDIYSSARSSFEAIWPRVSSGGFVVFDDYGFFGCDGVAAAVNGLRSEIHDAVFVHNLNGHGLFIKR